MRRLDLTFTALLVPLDFVALVFAALTAYSLRLSKAFQEIRPLLQAIPFPEFLTTAAAFAVVWILFFVMAGLYQPHYRKPWNELSRIILSCTAGIMVVIAIVFFQRQVTTSRFLILAVWGFSIAYTWAGRLFLRLIRNLLLRAGIGHQRIAIIGNGKTSQDLANFYRTKKQMGYTIVKSIKAWNGTTEKELDALVRRGQLDGVLLADPEISKNEALDIIEFCETRHIGFRYLADLFAARFTNIEVTTTNGVPLIEVKRTALDGWGKIAKRGFDIFFSLLVLIISSPIFLAVSLAILLQDGLPVIFQNERVGENGRRFRLYKFRSMWRSYSIGPQFEKNNKKNIEFEKQLIESNGIKEGPVYKIANDPRVMPVGRFTRRWSIDELTQFINVLKGEMSIVGPRPHQPREVEQYQTRHLRVLDIKPGITGMAQISGRSDLTFDEEVRLDTWYLEHWSPWLDLMIILKTPFAVIRPKGVY
ncbi:MAG TPA: sugar transferase [Patescibacteria group bacterium]|nr:sugar transferase [Patescibacteria group bacterium]